MVIKKIAGRILKPSLTTNLRLKNQTHIYLFLNFEIGQK